MHAAPPISYDDPTLIVSLLSIIQKMYCSPHDPVAEISNIRPYIILNNESWQWGKVAWKSNKLNRHKLPSQSCKKYILLKDLRGGADGRVWMACSSSGLVCVLKFGRLDASVFDSKELMSGAISNATKNLEHECIMHAQQDSDIIARVTVLADRPVLVMRHYSAVNWSDDGIKKKV